MLAEDAEDPRWRSAMRAAQDGDSRAYAAILRDCVPVIRAGARARGVGPDALDDVVQDVLLTIHRVRHTYDPDRPFLPWLRAIVRARAVDALRRRARQGSRELHAPLEYEQHADGSAGADELAAEASRAGRLRAAAASLPPGQRQAFELLGLEERSLADAAAHTGRSPIALKVNLHRALKALRSKLGGDHGP